MPGTSDLRAQAKWQQKCAKNNPTPSNHKEDKNKLLIALRGRIRDKELKSQTELCMKNLSINTLTYLRRRYEEQHEADMRWREMVLQLGVNPIYVDYFLTTGSPDIWSWARIISGVPYYEKGRELSEKKFRQNLEEEVKSELERISSKHIRELYYSFGRTLDRVAGHVV